MKKRLKKIYLEVTNACNLNCSFCIKNSRGIKYLSKNEFNNILDKLEPYTDYLYFHVLGEPLMHPFINEMIDIASKRFNVMITTNGYLIDRIFDNGNIKQVNISIHSYDKRYKVSLDDYMNNIFRVVDNLIKNNTYVSLRLWVKNEYQKEMVRLINEYYDCDIDLSLNSFKIRDYLYVKQFREFIWPDINNDYYSDCGSCYGTRDHLGILSDGTIVPCCLDTKGIINLGNINTDNIMDVLSSDRVIRMSDGFKNHKKCEELCKHCSFLE